MKKQTGQKTKGHKTNETSTTAPATSKDFAPLNASRITSLKDKNAAKLKKGNKR